MKDIARFFKVLADEARLKILWLLFNHRELCVCDIMDALDMTQSKASRHLATMRHAGLVTDRKEAAWSYYSLRSLESKLERSQLNTLRATLAGHPEAARMLRNLHAAMKRRDRDAGCAADGACRASTTRATGKARRKPLSRDKKGKP